MEPLVNILNMHIIVMCTYIGETILMSSARYPDVMKKLLENGADINMKDNQG